MASAEEFFRELWKNCEGYAELRPIRGARVSPRVFEIPKALGEFVAAAAKESGKTHVYYGICLRGQPKPRDPKAKTFHREDVTIVPAIWADVDLYRKEKGKYVPRFDLPYEQLKEKIHSDIRRLTDAVPATASIWSGGGYQLFWFLREPIVLEGPEDKDGERIEAINHSVGKAVGGDSVYNLDRIFRAPDTENIKGARPGQPENEAKMCRVVFLHPETRYDLDAFEEKLPIEESLQHIRTKGEKAEIPPPGEPVDLYALGLKKHIIEVIRGGVKSYIEYRHKTDTAEDFDNRDKSRSGADAWVVTELIAAGVEDQQIWDIYREPSYGISERYREKGDPYLQRTVTNCREVAEKAKKKREDKEKQEEDPDAKKVKIEIEKFKASKKIYGITVHLPDGTKATGQFDINTAWYFSKFEMAFWDQTGRMVPKMSQRRWRKLLDKCPKKEKEAPKEARTIESIASVIEDWFDDKVENPDSGTLQVKPGYDAERVFFRLKAFEDQLGRNGIKTSRPELCKILETMGWKDDRIRVKGKQVRLWYAPLKVSGNGQKTMELWPEKRDTI